MYYFLMQVLGKKYIRLYDASLSEELYPYTETMLCNSSQVKKLIIILMKIWHDYLFFICYPHILVFKSCFDNDNLLRVIPSTVYVLTIYDWPTILWLRSFLFEGGSRQHRRESVSKGGGLGICGLHSRGRWDALHPTKMVALCSILNN